ncbi:helix-turn-helix domain-containing protein [Rhizobium sp. SSA_523]|uniref:helix-turn-helix domain-containing protein n=1 Tax=Rhizobium sp. SSA_523 TaxID=2952477 RepID=UPI0020915C18|nr:helix-turn-helix domain-containing protein [Rhizobium sp. SSA_523]MCO5730246.1 helix-turn-helix domain-containing protein [Rhizobium sp. SSA_523]WKC25302.1 helix-turn-helix domain-containing protein [Rhizobium sp. SSA_523]
MSVREPSSKAATDASGGVECVSFAIGDPPERRGWHDILGPLFECAPRRALFAEGPDASLTVFHFGFFLVCHVVGFTGRLMRRLPQTALDDLDHLLVTIPLRGSIAFFDGAIRLARPGDVAISDLRAPLSCTLQASDAIHLVIPRLFMPQSVAPPDILAPRLLRGKKVSTVFLVELAQLLTNMPAHTEREEALALASVLRMPLAFCIGSAEPVRNASDPRGRSHLLRRHIEDNLDDPALTPHALANRFGLSRSQLFRQFESAGGVETFIRKRRLRQALLHLADPILFHRRIGEIAYEAGFKDEAHFSRLFRSTYGTSPRMFRRQAKQGRVAVHGHAGSAADDPVKTLLLWLTQLRDA